MRGIWASRHIPTSLKMRIYKTGVCSKMTYGSEAWCLNARVCTILNGANARMVARITNKTVHEEASAKTLRQFVAFGPTLDKCHHFDTRIVVAAGRGHEDQQHKPTWVCLRPIT